MRNLLSFLIILSVLSVSTLYAQSQGVPVDRVVAVVGANIVKLSDVENSYAQVRIRQGNDNAMQNRCEILESMMLTKLMIHKGQMDSVEVSDEEVESQVEYYLKAYLRQYGSKEALREATGYSYDEFHDVYFDLLKDRMISQRVENSLTSSVAITPKQVQEYFNAIPTDSLPVVEDEYEVSEITIQPVVSEDERAKVRLQLAELRERILKGEKFSMLATLYSQDPGSAKKGGELGFFNRGDMVSEFEAAAFALKPGEVSPVIETQFGFHIIQLIERRGNTVNARHILIQPNVGAEEMLAARIRLDSIAQAIRSGSISFEDAARKYSTSNTCRLGGVLANPQTGNNRFNKKMFADLYPGISLAAMNEGDISNATAMTDDEGKNLYRIVKLTKHIEQHKANLSDDYDKLYNAALAEAKHKKILEWSAKMIKNTYIRIDDEFSGCSFNLNWLSK